MSTAEIVIKVCNCDHVLHDDDVEYGNYAEQITYLIFLKMADERATLTPAISQGRRESRNYSTPWPIPPVVPMVIY
jgi:hypothetical protein